MLQMPYETVYMHTLCDKNEFVIISTNIFGRILLFFDDQGQPVWSESILSEIKYLCLHITTVYCDYFGGFHICKDIPVMHFAIVFVPCI